MESSDGDGWRAVEGDVLSYGISYVQELVPNEKPILLKTCRRLADRIEHEPFLFEEFNSINSFI
jgi:hypothetical protein